MSVQPHDNDPDTIVEDADTMTRPAFSYAVVKFFEADQSLYNTRFDTADLSGSDAERAIARLSELLDWQVINALLEQFAADGVTLAFRRIDDGQSWDALQKDYERGEAFTRSVGEEYESPEIETYYRFDVTAPSDDIAVSALTQLVEVLRAQGDTVEMAYVTSDMAAPPQDGTGTQVMDQSHFKPAGEAGMGIKSFQDTVSKSKGDGIRFVDLEQGWILAHDDLPPVAANALIEGVNLANAQNYPNPAQAFEYSAHGMMVLGIIIAKANGKGVTGIAPKARPYLASIRQYDAETEEYYVDAAKALGRARSRLREGDVLLIEAQLRPSVSVNGAAPAWLNVPYEAVSHLRDEIKSITNKGITVIEAAGNNRPGISLDTLDFPDGPEWSLPDKSKSAATVVAAGANAEGVTYERGPTTNFGAYIDCFADGDFLWLLNTPPKGYVGAWPPVHLVKGGATSSASAIIAGVALIIQSHARDKERVISPKQMRSILSDPKYGTKSKNTTDGIRTMPNLEKILVDLPQILKAAKALPNG